VLGDNDALINSPDKSVTACESGEINIDKEGTQCTEVKECTAQWYLENAANLETEAPISLEPGKVVGTNSLNLVVQHAAVKGRKVTGIVLKDGATREFSLFSHRFFFERSVCYVREKRKKRKEKKRKEFVFSLKFFLILGNPK
jgi:diaminopimelate decarboxylase